MEQMIKTNAKFNVIAKCSDGDIKIGKDGIYDFNYDEAKEIADAHKNLGAEITIVTAYEETV